MEIIYLAFANPDEKYLNDGCEKYFNRLSHYIKIQRIIIPPTKNAKSITFEQQKNKEGERILSSITPSDFVVLLDEKGKILSSENFSKYIQQHMNSGLKRLIFISGGPYGFNKEVYDRANFQLSLSLMTFTHQMVQLLFLEQLYRAMTILKGEPYHH